MRRERKELKVSRVYTIAVVLSPFSYFFLVCYDTALYACNVAVLEAFHCEP